MISLKSCSKYGVAQYVITKESEVNELPKKGLTIGSVAELINANGLKVFMFTQEEENTEGQWIEV